MTKKHRKLNLRLELMNKKDEMIIMCTVEFQISDFLLMEFDLKVMLNLKSSDHCTTYSYLRSMYVQIY